MPGTGVGYRPPAGRQAASAAVIAPAIMGKPPSRQPSRGLIARSARRSIKANWVWNRWERKGGPEWQCGSSLNMPHRAQLQTRTLNARAIVRLPKSCKASDVISVCQSPSGLLCAINKPGHESRSLFLERCKLNAVHLRDVAHAEKCDGFGLVVTLNLDTALLQGSDAVAHPPVPGSSPGSPAVTAVLR